jgi:hypothetical protein
MPLIQIEQDSPEVIERARQEIASLARDIATGADRHSQTMLFLGYCRALTHERLISVDVLGQLNAEMARAVEDQTAIEG